MVALACGDFDSVFAWFEMAEEGLVDVTGVAPGLVVDAVDQGRFLAGGGRDGTIHVVVDLVNWHLKHTDRDVWIESLDTRQVPRFRYRWLWTWDNRMDWGGPGKPVTRMGGGKYDCRTVSAGRFEVRGTKSRNC